MGSSGRGEPGAQTSARSLSAAKSAGRALQVCVAQDTACGKFAERALRVTLRAATSAECDGVCERGGEIPSISANFTQHALRCARPTLPRELSQDDALRGPGHFASGQFRSQLCRGRPPGTVHATRSAGNFAGRALPRRWARRRGTFCPRPTLRAHHPELGAVHAVLPRATPPLAALGL